MPPPYGQRAQPPNKSEVPQFKTGGPEWPARLDCFAE
jgi:hypothetical protein